MGGADGSTGPHVDDGTAAMMALCAAVSGNHALLEALQPAVVTTASFGSKKRVYDIDYFSQRAADANEAVLATTTAHAAKKNKAATAYDANVVDGKHGALPMALVRDMLGLTTSSIPSAGGQGAQSAGDDAMVAGATEVADRFLKETIDMVQRTKGGNNAVKKFDEEYWGTDIATARANIAALAAEAFSQGLRDSTKATYDSGVRSYELFCDKYEYQAYPADEVTLIAFVSWSSVRIDVASINNYLAAVRSKHIECDAKWVERADMPKLQRVLNGFKWMEMATKDGRLRLPLTHKILGNVIDTKWRLFREVRKNIDLRI